MTRSLSALRREYARQRLCRADVDPDPTRQFRRWLDQALEAKALEPTAMTLATADPEGRPSARVVLLKGADEKGFCFFTNYESRKGRELDRNPRVALVFHWPELERQVRIEGKAERLTQEESDAYFASRPRGSRLSAWASRQSERIDSREELEARMREAEALHGDNAPPRPPYWGGYRVIPDSAEFWQGRADRLHDRLLYVRDAGGSWVLDRLQP